MSSSFTKLKDPQGFIHKAKKLMSLKIKGPIVVYKDSIYIAQTLILNRKIRTKQHHQQVQLRGHGYQTNKLANV